MSDLDAMIEVGDDIFDEEIIKDRAIEFINDKRHHLCLAYLGGNIIGMASAIHYVHPDKEPAMFILEAGVLEEHQNQGIGRTLIKKMVAFGKELGCEEIWVATEQSNLPARKAYKVIFLLMCRIFLAVSLLAIALKWQSNRFGKLFGFKSKVCGKMAMKFQNLAVE